MSRPLFIICALLVFALGAAIAAVNPQALRVELLFAEVELTRGQWLIVAFLFGWIAGVLSAWLFVRRLMQERADLRRHLRLAEAELKNIRPLPRDGV
jgi:uncharacterized membrane protein YciS (DUF1049 family)